MCGSTEACLGSACVDATASCAVIQSVDSTNLFGPGAPIMGSAAPLTRRGQTVPLPMPMDYFTTMPASDTPGCGDGENPALYLAIR
jgi:hypothetical protein